MSVNFNTIRDTMKTQEPKLPVKDTLSDGVQPGEERQVSQHVQTHKKDELHTMLEHDEMQKLKQTEKLKDPETVHEMQQQTQETEVQLQQLKEQLGQQIEKRVVNQSQGELNPQLMRQLEQPQQPSIEKLKSIVPDIVESMREDAETDEENAGQVIDGQETTQVREKSSPKQLQESQLSESERLETEATDNLTDQNEVGEQSKEVSEAKQKLDDAIKLFKKGKPEELENLCLKLLKKKPDHPQAGEALAYIALEQMKKGDSKLLNGILKGDIKIPEAAKAKLLDGMVFTALEQAKTGDLKLYNKLAQDPKMPPATKEKLADGLAITALEQAKKHDFSLLNKITGLNPEIKLPELTMDKLMASAIHTAMQTRDTSILEKMGDKGEKAAGEIKTFYKAIEHRDPKALKDLGPELSDAIQKYHTQQSHKPFEALGLVSFSQLDRDQVYELRVSLGHHIADLEKQTLKAEATAKKGQHWYTLIDRSDENKTAKALRSQLTELQALEGKLKTLEQLKTELADPGIDGFPKIKTSLQERVSKLEKQLTVSYVSKAEKMREAFDGFNLGKTEQALDYLSVGLFGKKHDGMKGKEGPVLLRTALERTMGDTAKELAKFSGTFKGMGTIPEDPKELKSWFAKFKLEISVRADKFGGEWTDKNLKLQQLELQLGQFIVLERFKDSGMSLPEFNADKLSGVKNELTELGIDTSRHEFTGTKTLRVFGSEGIFAGDQLTVLKITKIATNSREMVAKDTSVSSLVREIDKSAPDKTQVATGLSDRLFGRIKQPGESYSLVFDRRIKASFEPRIPIGGIMSVGVGGGLEYRDQDVCQLKKNPKGEFEVVLYQGSGGGGQLSASFNAIDLQFFRAGVHAQVSGTRMGSTGVKLTFSDEATAKKCLQGILLQTLSTDVLKKASNVEQLERTDSEVSASVGLHAKAGYQIDDGSGGVQVGGLDFAVKDGSLKLSPLSLTALADLSYTKQSSDTTYMSSYGEHSGSTVRVTTSITSWDVKKSITPMLAGISAPEKLRLEANDNLVTVGNKTMVTTDKTGKVTDVQKSITVPFSSQAFEIIDTYVTDETQKAKLKKMVQDGMAKGATQITINLQAKDPGEAAKGGKANPETYTLSSVSMQRVTSEKEDVSWKSKLWDKVKSLGTLSKEKRLTHVEQVQVTPPPQEVRV